MKLRAILIASVVTALLLGAAGWLYAHPAHDGGKEIQRAVSAVRDIMIASTDWSMELMRVQDAPDPDFDGLAAFVPRMAALKTELARAARGIPGMPQPLAADIAAYAATVTAKEERIERYKSGYALLRNSQQFLPVAAADAEAAATEIDDDSLAAAVANLAADIAGWIDRPDVESASRAAALARSLRASLTGAPASPGEADGWARPVANEYPVRFGSALDAVVNHANVLVRQLRSTEDDFRAAMSDDISALSAELVRDLEAEADGIEAKAGQYEAGMFAAVAALAVFWIGFAVQQTRAARAAPAPAGTPALPPAKQGDAPAAARATARRTQTIREAAASARRRAEEPTARRTPEPGPEPAPAPEPAAETASPEPAPEAAAASGADEPAIDSRRALEHDLIAASAADAFAQSADRIAGDMRRMQQAYDRMREALQGAAEAFAEPIGGVDIRDELETVSTLAQNAQREADGVARFAQRLASLSAGPADFDGAPVDVNACVDEIIAALDAEAAAAVVRNTGAVPEIFGSKSEIRLLIAKVVENSVRAVTGARDGKGTIKIDTAARGGEILITVIDNGEGIPRDRRKRIFEPFYTSHDGAAGMGLTLADRLARKYNGSVRVSSIPGQGTMTRIALRLGASEP